MTDLKKIEANYKKVCEIYDYMDLRILKASDSEFRVSIPLTNHTQNHVKMMHAGVLFSVGEVVGGLVVTHYIEKPEKFQPVVRDVKIDFKAPAFSDVTAVAYFTPEEARHMNAELDAHGRFDFELKADILNDAGEVVAQTSANYALRNFMGK